MNNRVFYNWVPQKLDAWLLILISCTLAFTQGISSTITSYVIGSQSSIGADVSMASFAFYTGMTCVLPFNVRLQQYIGKKQIFGVSFVLLIFINYILAATDQPLVMVMASFAMGFLKMVATLLVVINLIPILMPRGERYQLYCIYYPISMIFSPVSGYIAAYFSDTLNWKLSFHVQNLLLFFGLIIVMLFVSGKHEKKIPFYQFDWLGLILMATSMLLGSYVLTYGLTENWLESPHIKIGIAGTVVTFLLFVLRNFQVKRPIIRPSILHFAKPLLGFVVMCLLCVFFNTSALLTPLLNITLKGNPLESARINAFAIPGYIAGSIIAYFYYRKYTNFKPMALTAGIAFLLSNVMLYFMTASTVMSSYFFLPLFLRSVATIITYIAIGIYITSNTPTNYFNDIVTVLILLRSLVVPLIASSVFSNWLYRGQLKYLYKLSENIDATGTLSATRGGTLVSSVRTQASLLAIRDIYGALIVFGILMLIFLAVYPFHGTFKRNIFNWKNPEVAKEEGQTLPL